MKKYLFLFAVVSTLIACDKGSSKDPEAVDLGEFNPPGVLQTLTRSEKLVLTWVGGNAEDDFQGYHAFGTTKSIAGLQELVAFPEDADVTKGASIPRCEDNSAFFEAFGFPESTAKCEASVIEEGDVPEDDNPGVLIGGGLGTIIEDEEATEEEEDEEEAKIDFNLACTGDDQGEKDGDISLPAVEGKGLGRMFCDVEKAWDADAEEAVALANGTTYTFLVVAVKGSDKNEISWISNLVEDTPAHTLFAEQIEISSQMYRRIEIDYDTFAEATVDDELDCTAAICKLSTGGAASNNTGAEGIFIGRDQQNANYRQRLFVSTSTHNGGKLQLQARGSETWTDPRDGSVLNQKPGDEAQTVYADAGRTFALFGDQVFDLKATTGDGTRYGKVVITNLTLEDDADSVATLDVTIVLQEAIDNYHYIHR